MHPRDHEPHDDHGGLFRDLGSTGMVIGRRRLVRMALGAGALQLLGCGNAVGLDDNGTGGSCARIPEETAGPYPGDGSNGPSVLNQTGVVRSDIRSSFAGLSGAAAGIPLQVVLTIVSASACAPLAGRAVYLWHCDRAGLYSLYSAGVTNQNYLRGVQETDAAGKATFTTIFPGCYAGRWPHIHFEVFASLAQATNVANKSATSQLAFPKSACDAAYATTGYETSRQNLGGVSITSDMVFSDSGDKQTAAMTGSVAAGYVANLLVSV